MEICVDIVHGNSLERPRSLCKWDERLDVGGIGRGYLVSFRVPMVVWLGKIDPRSFV